MVIFNFSQSWIHSTNDVSFVKDGDGNVVLVSNDGTNVPETITLAVRHNQQSVISFVTEDSLDEQAIVIKDLDFLNELESMKDDPPTSYVTDEMMDDLRNA